ncbi:hypothetical protein AAE02nite_36960 [Adhaeribacter aerolatus]|uniref:DUF4468 domain-containing protein n=1 Tax=Adhaeribacter aerolatus TaxID=670289 RepID=A0A512B250_9BACT|nr:DUF4468 domain-containing protein [Adhaeribacter aerolatus]GEO06032.1 hypothetical protein AAE02nite_36960 [Adhaeribacter aerolatus]
MKLLLLFSLLSFNFWAQTFPVDPLSGKIYYAEEVLVKDGPQFDLYHRAKAWFAAGKNKKALQTDDLANGLLVGRNYRFVSVPDGNKAQTYRLWYTVKLEMEDDRYWYSITDFLLEGEQLPNAAGVKAHKSKVPLEALVLTKNGTDPKEKKEILNKLLEKATHKSILALIKELKASML